MNRTHLLAALALWGSLGIAAEVWINRSGLTIRTAHPSFWIAWVAIGAALMGFQALLRTRANKAVSALTSAAFFLAFFGGAGLLNYPTWVITWAVLALAMVALEALASRAEGRAGQDTQQVAERP